MNKKIVHAAKLWLGTPFHLQGRVRNIGCDCLGLLMGIAKELNIKTTDGTPLVNFDRSDYHIIHDGKILEDQLDKLLEQTDQIEEGSLLLLEYDKNPQHLAIASSENSMIHAHIKHRKVVEHSIDVWIRNKIKKIYKLK
jgi:cell wall-associated NlpC family hydrolase